MLVVAAFSTSLIESHHASSISSELTAAEYRSILRARSANSTQESIAAEKAVTDVTHVCSP